MLTIPQPTPGLTLKRMFHFSPPVPVRGVKSREGAKNLFACVLPPAPPKTVWRNVFFFFYFLEGFGTSQARRPSDKFSALQTVTFWGGGRFVGMNSSRSKGEEKQLEFLKHFTFVGECYRIRIFFLKFL